jgi:hypothetical protein
MCRSLPFLAMDPGLRTESTLQRAQRVALHLNVTTEWSRLPELPILASGNEGADNVATHPSHRMESPTADAWYSHASKITSSPSLQSPKFPRCSGASESEISAWAHSWLLKNTTLLMRGNLIHAMRSKLRLAFSAAKEHGFLLSPQTPSICLGPVRSKCINWFRSSGAVKGRCRFPLTISYPRQWRSVGRGAMSSRMREEPLRHEFKGSRNLHIRTSQL